MSLLDEAINGSIESTVMLRSLLRDYDPAVRNVSRIGGASAGHNTTVDGIYALNTEAFDLNNGELKCKADTAISGNLEWDKYGIRAINGDKNLVFLHGDIDLLAKRAELKEIAAHGILEFRYNFTGFARRRFRGCNIYFFGLWFCHAGIEDCTFNSRKVCFSDMPYYFKNVHGTVDTMRISIMDFQDFEKAYGNHIRPQQLGPKKVKDWRTLRAFYNNRKKYSKYWIDPTELIDCEALIKSMGLENLNLQYLYIRDCTFQIVFQYRNGRWNCNECAAK